MGTQQPKATGEVEVTLVQFKSMEPPKSKVFRRLQDEDVDAAKKRRASKAGFSPPVSVFRHTGVIPEKLKEILKNLTVVDARHQRRMAINDYDHSVKYHILTEVEYRKASANEPTRDKELASKEMSTEFQRLLDERWEQVLVTTFPNKPGLRSILFVGRALDPKNAEPIDDPKAEQFGMLVTRRGEK